MKPEFTPPFSTGNGGSCDMCLSIISEMRRSDSEPISANAVAVIGGHRHRFGMEVAAGQHVTLFGEHQRVIGDGVGFYLQHLGGTADLRQAGAHHLRLAAQGVRILHFSQLRCESETSLRAPSRWR